MNASLSGTSKSQDHLLNLIRNSIEDSPHYCLLLGAGASVTSGVRSASEMIKEWRKEYHKIHGAKQEYKQFIEKQPWYRQDEEYSFLFGELFDQPSQRRDYIELCLKKASPSWGYIYLVNLLRHKLFRTVFTTNFDDLINEACYRYSSSVRPTVVAHDSMIRNVRMLSQRPQVIKLHGDFHFDSIKNTMEELQSLETNMRDKVKDYANEFGLIVVGYSGRDKSIMDIIRLLLKNESYFRHGVYWCHLASEPVSRNVSELSVFRNFHTVKIKGFDQFFAELHEELGLSIQSEMSDPYVALSDRLNELSKMNDSPDKTENLIINRDIKRLADTVNSFFESWDSHKEHTSEDDSIVIKRPKNVNVIPFQLLSDAAWRMGDNITAKMMIMQQLTTKPDFNALSHAINIYIANSDVEFETQIIEFVTTNTWIFKDNLDEVDELAITLMNNAKWHMATIILESGCLCFYEGYNEAKVDLESWIDHNNINKMLIKRLQGLELSSVDVEILNSIIQNRQPKGRLSDHLVSAGAMLLLGDVNAACSLFSGKIEDYMLSWPIFKLIPDDLFDKLKPVLK